jgi:DUF1680 family protein
MGGILLSRPADVAYDIGGWVGEYLEKVTDQWLHPVPAANPGILEMFRDRDRRPLRDMMPWAGEFAGKYLTSAVQILRLTGDPDLRERIAAFAKELTALQADDGYLGPWPKRSRLTGTAPNGGKKVSTWDAWGHYHAMLGLLLWHEDSGDRGALTCARRMGDLICRKFLGKAAPGGKRLVDTGSTEMNLAVIHSLCLLHQRTGGGGYLDMAVQIAEEEFPAAGPDGPLAGDYKRAALAGTEFFETPKPRWESLHPIMGMLELSRITGEEEYASAFEQIWWSIVKLDRHNNGGFTSGERAQGNPYHQGAIETCCTIAWIAMSVEMLRLTGHSVVADEIELSTLNSVIGLHSQSGRWVTYDTPMDGVRKASAHHIVFQAREGTPELNCCSVNGPRGLGMISDWALMVDAAPERDGAQGLVLNWYGPSEMSATVAGASVKLIQETDYPRRNRVRLLVEPSRAVEFTLKLRIPYWSERTRVRVNGDSVKDVKSGTYLSLKRRWKRGDSIDIDLDFSLHFWKGQKECGRKVSVYRGPVLLTYDRRFNEVDPPRLPELDAAMMKGKLVRHSGAGISPFMLLEYAAGEGERLRLCDFASAGEGGSPYVSWLKVKNVKATRYSPANPLRSGRVN